MMMMRLKKMCHIRIPKSLKTLSRIIRLSPPKSFGRARPRQGILSTRPLEERRVDKGFALATIVKTNITLWPIVRLRIENTMEGSLFERTSQRTPIGNLSSRRMLPTRSLQELCCLLKKSTHLGKKNKPQVKWPPLP